MSEPERSLDRRFEAIVFDWEGTAVPDRRSDAGAVRQLVEALCAAGVEIAVVSGTHIADVDSQLGARPPSPGRLILALHRDSEVYEVDTTGPHLVQRLRTTPSGDAALELTDKADTTRWLIDDFARRGIRPSEVLVLGDEFGPLGSDSLGLIPEADGAVAASVGPEPRGVPEGVVALGGGPECFARVLADQLHRRARLDLPIPIDVPAWSITATGRPGRRDERDTEALLTVGDGRIGTNGAPVLASPDAEARVLVAGVYDGDGPATHLLEGPIWFRLPGEPAAAGTLRRSLDLRTGVLHECVDTTSGVVCSMRFSSLADPGTVVMRAVLDRPSRVGHASPPVLGPRGDAPTTSPEGVAAVSVTGTHGGITAVATERWVAGDDGSDRVDRVAVIDGNQDGLPVRTDLVARQCAAAERGFDRLLGDHRAAWSRRWDDADIVIHGDDRLQRAVRFALFHLMASVGDRGEAAVGARGLTGPAYRGHVFWDADVFVLPFLAATHPDSARAMIEYRLRRMPQALAAAAELGASGARFPWESAHSGRDVTPSSARDRAGRLVPIRTGSLEVHIVADVAWAAASYIDWTGDETFARGDGATMLIETARYWASRIRVERDGTAHIYGVVGPDEYHEPVDDNAFTNVMARWNLRRAASAAAHCTDLAERSRWLMLADALVDGYDSETGIYEQFAGFHRLEPLVLAEVAPRRPIAADLLLGPERVASSQVIKQADVLMLHQLVPEEVEPDSLEPNLRFYEPRTAHGSSLSPGIHAALHARARDDERALESLDLAAGIDLEDSTATTAGGLHLGAMGTVWQALVLGFGGVRPTADGALEMDPRLPASWHGFEIRLRYRGSRVRLQKARGSCTVTASAPVPVRIGGTRYLIGPSEQTFFRRGSHWEAS